MAANITIDSFALVGIPGLTSNAILAVALNLGFALGDDGAAFSAIDFKASFSYDENADENHNGTPEETGLQGYALDTGDPLNRMIIDFESTFIEVQLAGSSRSPASPVSTASSTSASTSTRTHRSSVYSRSAR